jgi:hypothetical protein
VRKSRIIYYSLLLTIYLTMVGSVSWCSAVWTDTVVSNIREYETDADNGIVSYMLRNTTDAVLIESETENVTLHSGGKHKLGLEHYFNRNQGRLLLANNTCKNDTERYRSNAHAILPYSFTLSRYHYVLTLCRLLC